MQCFIATMLNFTAKYIVIFVKMRMKLILRDEIIKAICLGWNCRKKIKYLYCIYL